jgi:hypothetical protein
LSLIQEGIGSSQRRRSAAQIIDGRYSGGDLGNVAKATLNVDRVGLIQWSLSAFVRSRISPTLPRRHGCAVWSTESLAPQ